MLTVIGALVIYKRIDKLQREKFIFLIEEVKHRKLLSDLCVIMHAARSWYELGKNLLFELSSAYVQIFN